MKKEEIKNLSTVELSEKEKSLKSSTGFLAGLLLVLFLVTLYSTITEKEFDVLMVVPFALSVIVITNYRTIKSIQTELLTREN